jgi:hypothetical protein
MAVATAVSVAASGPLAPSRPHPAVTDTPPTTLLEVSRFRFCNNAPCDPDNQGYVRGPSGPVPGGDNPAGRIRVVPGRRVTWTYADDACDAFGTPPLDCPGHEIRFENGSSEGTAPIGFLPARSGSPVVEWTVPLDAKPGSLIRYFCAVKSHYLLGLTGVFEVVNPVTGR